MHALKGPFKVFLDVGKLSIDGRASGNDDIVDAATCVRFRQAANGGFEPPPDFVAVHGAAQRPGDRKAEAGTRRCLRARLAILAFQNGASGISPRPEFAESLTDA
jgi:hypothetical protein